MRDHMSSIRLENAARRALGLNSRGGVGGVIDADFIDSKGAFTVIVAALTPFYKDGNNDIQERINEFIERYYFLTDDIPDDEYSEGVDRAAQELNNLLNEL